MKARRWVAAGLAAGVALSAAGVAAGEGSFEETALGGQLASYIRGETSQEDLERHLDAPGVHFEEALTIVRQSLRELEEYEIPAVTEHAIIELGGENMAATSVKCGALFPSVERVRGWIVTLRGVEKTLAALSNESPAAGDSRLAEAVRRAQSLGVELDGCFPYYSSLRLLDAATLRYLHRYPAVLRHIDKLRTDGSLAGGSEKQRAEGLVASIGAKLNALAASGGDTAAGSQGPLTLESLGKRGRLSPRWTETVDAIVTN